MFQNLLKNHTNNGRKQNFLKPKFVDINLIDSNEHFKGELEKI